MHSQEDSEDEFSNDQFASLKVELENWEVKEIDSLEIHNRLSGLANELVNETIRAALGKQAHKDQIVACRKLEKSAMTIDSQFDFLSQFSPLEIALSDAYKLVAAQSCGTGELPINWSAFRERLLREAALLLDAVHSVRAELMKHGGARGQPANEWKNHHFSELFTTLSELLREPDVVCAEVAFAIWNIYFRTHKIETSESALKIVQRMRKRKCVKDINR